MRYRIDGVLADKINIPHQLHQSLVSHLKIMTDLDISERRRPQGIILASAGSGYKGRSGIAHHAAGRVTAGITTFEEILRVLGPQAEEE